MQYFTKAFNLFGTWFQAPKKRYVVSERTLIRRQALRSPIFKSGAADTILSVDRRPSDLARKQMQKR